MNRDPRCMAPLGSGYRGTYDTDTAARLAPRRGHIARLVRLVLGVPGWLRSALFVEVHVGELLPKRYGLAWVHYDRNTAVASPIPLNVIFHRARLLWFWFKRGGREVALTPAEAFEAGMQQERARWQSWVEDPLG